MKTLKYSDKLKDPRWQKKRLEVMARDNFACKLCGDSESTLNVHHKKYTESNIWDERLDNLITLCNHCHYIIHNYNTYIHRKIDIFGFDFKIFKSKIFEIDDLKSYIILLSEPSFIDSLILIDENGKLFIEHNFQLHKASFDSIIKAINHSIKYQI